MSIEKFELTEEQRQLLVVLGLGLSIAGTFISLILALTNVLGPKE